MAIRRAIQNSGATYLKKFNLQIPVEDILITNGSQQGLDLFGKVLLNDGDGVVIEEPGYLGAIQAFSLYKTRFLPIPVSDQGMDPDRLRAVLSSDNPKLAYTVANFQNPSGISYPEENRRELANIIEGTRTLLIEDDPYGDLRFAGNAKSSFKTLLPDNTLMLGSFSKCIAPGFRLGWIVAPPPIMKKLVTAKQASDLHTTHLIQCIVARYLRDNDIDKHVQTVSETYGKQCAAMLSSMDKAFPSGVTYSKPEGGMFLWVELPRGAVALDLFELAIQDKVVFVPGDPFYTNRKRVSTLRLNFSCVDEKTIEIGIQRLGNAIRRILEKNT
jgi:2-aminoadipate transaminase